MSSLKARTVLPTLLAFVLAAMAALGTTVVVRAHSASPNRSSFQAAAGAAPHQAVPSGYAGLCPPSAPTVRMDGRGLAATGVAYVGDTTGPLINSLDVTVESKGYSAAVETPKADHSNAMITSALLQAGVAASDIHTSYYTYGDPNAHVYVITETINARMSSAQQVREVLPSLATVPGINGWSTDAGSATDFAPTAAAVGAGVASATEQAKALATSGAAAAGLKLGQLYSVTTLPLTLCSGSPSYWLQEVTVVYPAG